MLPVLPLLSSLMCSSFWLGCTSSRSPSSSLYSSMYVTFTMASTRSLALFSSRNKNTSWATRSIRPPSSSWRGCGRKETQICMNIHDQKHSDALNMRKAERCCSRNLLFLVVTFRGPIYWHNKVQIHLKWIPTRYWWCQEKVRTIERKM